MECDPSTPPLVDTEVTLGCGPSGGDGPSQEALLRFEVPNERIIHVATEPDQMEPPVLSNVVFYRCTGGDAIGFLGHTAGFHIVDHNLTIDPAQPASAFALDVPPGEYVAWFTSPAERHTPAFAGDAARASSREVEPRAPRLRDRRRVAAWIAALHEPVRVDQPRAVIVGRLHDRSVKVARPPGRLSHRIRGRGADSG